MTDQDTIRILQSDVVRLTRANELLQARLDELRMVFRQPPPVRMPRRLPDTPAAALGETPPSARAKWSG